MKRPPTPFELKKSVSGKGNNQNAAPPRRPNVADCVEIKVFRPWTRDVVPVTTVT